MGGEHSGHSAAQNSERRTLLTVRRPEIISALVGAGISENSDEGRAAQVWAASMLQARDAWADANRHGRRYSDREARGPSARPSANHRR